MSDYIDKRLLKLSKAGGKYIKLDVGDSFKGFYLTWRAERDEKFDKMKPVYIFKTENGEEKQLGTGAKKFGSKMARVIPGSLVQITKLGEGQKTDFSVKVLKAAKMPANIDDDLEDDVEEGEEEEAPEVFATEEAAPKKKKKKVVEVEDDEEEEDEDDGLFA